MVPLFFWRTRFGRWDHRDPLPEQDRVVGVETRTLIAAIERSIPAGSPVSEVRSLLDGR